MNTKSKWSLPVRLRVSLDSQGLIAVTLILVHYIAKDFSVDIRNLLDINWADVSRAAKSNQLELSYLIRRKDGHKLEISVVTVSEEEKAATDAWKESTLRKAYGGMNVMSAVL